MTTLINETILMLAAAANYFTFIILLCYRREPKTVKKTELSILAWLVACFVLGVGTHFLKVIVEGGFIPGGIYALGYLLISLGILWDIAKHKGNISHAVRGVPHG